MKSSSTFISVTLCAALTACGHGPLNSKPGADATPRQSEASPQAAQAAVAPADEATVPQSGAVAPPANAALNSASQTAAPELAIENMAVARPVGKSSVPVDVRYQVSGPVAKNESASLQLAFIPRVAGSALRVEFPRSESVSVSETAELTVQKALPASVHRHNLVVTPLKGDSGEVRAVVSMDVEGGRHFGIFVIPVASTAR